MVAGKSFSYTHLELDEQEEDLDEKIVEKSIVANVKKFIMTFGQDFSFIGNQYRVEVARGNVH